MTPRDIAQGLSAHVEDICRQLLPHGKRIGPAWCVGSIHGEEGKSLKVKLTGSKVGQWADFASTEKGDLLHLYQYTMNVSLKDAIDWGKKYLGVEDTHDFLIAKTKPKPIPASETKGISFDGLAWMKKRGISEKTLYTYGVACSGTVIEFPYVYSGDTYMIKYRDIAKPKKEGIYTSKGSTPALFGWSAVPDNARSIIITEGELDALAYAEQGHPALSIPYGAGVAGKMRWIENEYDNLERFDDIYLSMDMDKEGQACLEEYVKRLDIHRCRIISLPDKDANAVHLAGGKLTPYIESARYMDPKELRSAISFEEDVWNQFYPTDEKLLGLSLPWSKAGDKFRLRPHEVTGWVGINGHGKTKILSQITVHGIAQDTKWCVASMEMPAPVLLRSLYQQVSGAAVPPREIFDEVSAFVDEHLWIVNVLGTAKADRLIEIFRYAWKRYGIQHVVIDSLAKCGMAEDDYNAQKAFIDTCGDLAQETGLHINIVMHSRKRHDENQAPNKLDVKGTGAITDMIDNVVSVWRNKPKEEKVAGYEYKHEAVPESVRGKPDCVLQVHKQRHYDWEGKLYLWYRTDIHQFLDQKDGQPFDYVTEVF